MKTIGIIPARYQSARFPGKPLININGKSMIERVYLQAKASNLDQAVVATDDDRIFSHCQERNIPVEMTSTEHQSGTDRCAEVARNCDADLVINIQGDEPFIDPEQINALIKLASKENFQIGTLIKPIEDTFDLGNPNKVKVVIAKNTNALYFSRQAIPFQRNNSIENWLKEHTYYRHIGLYAYRKTTLLEITKLELSSLEKTELLEQLRWLENGYSISTAVTHSESPNIDTPEDLEKVLKSL